MAKELSGIVRRKTGFVAYAQVGILGLYIFKNIILLIHISME